MSRNVTAGRRVGVAHHTAKVNKLTLAGAIPSGGKCEGDGRRGHKAGDATVAQDMWGEVAEQGQAGSPGSGGASPYLPGFPRCLACDVSP
jgi:hypothetical protein